MRLPEALHEPVPDLRTRHLTDLIAGM